MKDNHDFKNAVSLLLMSTKPYEGFLFDREKLEYKTGPKIRFYDEKEWRYIPLIDDISWSIPVNEDFESRIADKTKKLHEKHRLTFSIDDVKYIFLEKESDRDSFLLKMEETKKYSPADMEKIESYIEIIP